MPRGIFALYVGRNGMASMCSSSGFLLGSSPPTREGNAMQRNRSTRLGNCATGLLIVVVGLPIAYLLVVFSWGVVLVLVVVAVYAAPWFTLHYLVWGRAFGRKIRLEESAANISD